MEFFAMSKVNEQDRYLKKALEVAILSFIFPGLGQLRLGQRERGAKILLIGLLICWLGGLFNIWAARDAYLAAKRHNKKA